MSIPKIIHYCWFGGKPKSQEIKKCIESWSQLLNEYEIIEWNESNYRSDSFFYNYCIDKKKLAFASDYARYDILSRLGGVYLDTDMLMVKPLNDLLDTDCFFGYESNNNISCGIIASIKNQPFINEVLYFLNSVDNEKYFDTHNIVSVTNSVYQKSINSNLILLPIVYPQDYFYAYPYNTSGEPMSFKTANTYAIHLWNASWYSLIQRAELFFNKGQIKKARLLFLKSVMLNPLNIRFFKKFYLKCH